MHLRRITYLIMVLLTAATALVLGDRGQAETALAVVSPVIPTVWDDAAMAALELPLADSPASPKHISEDYYYRIPVRPIYKSYPVYAPGKEPPGYWEWLKQQEPALAFDASILKTEADWIRAGEVVFDAPIFYGAVVNAS